MKPLYKLMTQLSSNKLISTTTGKVAKHRFSRLLIPRFAKTYKIRVEEAEKSPTEYTSLNEFFTRRLKLGARTIHAHADSVVSPVDALITGLGEIKNGTIVNVKGQAYTISEMLGDEQQAKVYDNGTYIVLYLSPTDYHRIHAPISGTILKHVHVPGKVYPVNDFGLRYMKRVLSRNERLITYIQNEDTELAVVKVGALNVASIQLSDQLTSTEIHKGDELAYFEFGSTVVLLLREKSIELRPDLQEGTRVQMGEKIGRMARKVNNSN